MPMESKVEYAAATSPATTMPTRPAGRYFLIISG